MDTPTKYRPDQAMRRRRPPLTVPPQPKRPDKLTAATLQLYVDQLGSRASLISRTTTVAEWTKANARGTTLNRNLAGIEPTRHLTSLKFEEGVNAKRCTAQTRRGTPCRMVAVRGMNVCYFHGGKKTVELRLAKRGIPPKTRNRAFGTAYYKLVRDGVIPLELQRHPAFQALALGPPTRDKYVQLVRLVSAFLHKDQTPEIWLRVLHELKNAGRF